MADLPPQATAALAEVAGVAGVVREWLSAFASATGLVVMRQMMEAARTNRIGAEYAERP